MLLTLIKVIFAFITWWKIDGCVWSIQSNRKRHTWHHKTRYSYLGIESRRDWKRVLIPLKCTRYRCAHKLLDTLFLRDIFHYASSEKSKQSFFILGFELDAVNFISIMFYCHTLWLHTIAFQLRDSSNNAHLSYCFFRWSRTIKRSHVWFKYFKKSDEFQLSAQDYQAMERKKDVKTTAGKRLTEETKWWVIFLKKEGQLSNRQIASRCKVSPLTVSNLWASYRETGSMAERNDRRTRRPRKTTPRQNRALVRSSERDRFETAPQLRRYLIQEGTELSLSTI